MTKKDVFIVEDDALLAWALTVQIEELGYRVAGTAANAPEAVMEVLRLRPAAVLMDVRLAEGTNGFDAARQIRFSSRVPIIFCTAYADVPGIAEEVETIDNCRLVGKPATERQLRRLLNDVLSHADDVGPDGHLRPSAEATAVAAD